MSHRPGQPSDRHLNKAPRRMLFILLGLAIALIAFLVMLYPIVIEGTPKTETIHIPARATDAAVHDTLAKYYGDGFASRVMRLARVRKADFSLRHGAYRIEEGSNVLSVMRRITSGAQTPVTITVNGFRKLSTLADRISRKLDFPADSLLDVLEDPEVLSRYGLTREQAIALFLDDSYEFYWSASPREVVKKIGDNYLRLWNDERRRKAAALGLSPAEVMTVCSIVDEETNAESEKGTVGRLYINRLDRGMRLQADPTVRYAADDFTIRRVRGEHLKVNSPYNTYMFAGLPPGPIRTVGQSTIDLVLDSQPNNYIYMCAKEDFSGTHNFAATYDEHSRNAARYQKALDGKGIK